MTTNVTRFEDRRESDIDFFVHLNDGKYTYRRYKDGRQDALRFGSDWRTTDDMAGDNLIAAMGYLIESQQTQIESLKAQIKDQAQKIMGADNSKQMIQMLRSEKGRDAIKNAIHLLDVKGDPFFSYDNMTALMEVRDMIEDSETPDQRLVDKLKSDDVNGAVRHVIALIPHKGDLLFDLGTMNVMEQLQGMINGQHHPKNDQHFLVIPFTQPDERYSPKDAEEIMGTMIDSVETEMAVFGKPVAVEMGNEANLSDDMKREQDSIISRGDAERAYHFAKDIPGADVKSLQAVIAQSGQSKWIHFLALNVPNVDIKSLEQSIIDAKDTESAYRLASDSRIVDDGLDVRAMERVIIENGLPYEAGRFAADVPGANIEALRHVALNTDDPKDAELFNEIVAARRFLDEPDDVVVMSSKTDIKPTNNTMRND